MKSRMCIHPIVGSVLLVGFAAAPATAQDRVSWNFSVEPATARRGEIATVHLQATTSAGWYVYSHTLKEGGPQPTRFTFDLPAGVRQIGAVEAPPPKKKHDEGFQMEVEYYAGSVDFAQKALVDESAKIGPLSIQGTVIYQTCNDVTCLPPKKVPFVLDITVEEGSPRDAYRAPTTATLTSAPPAPQAAPAQTKPPVASVGRAGDVTQARHAGLLAFLLLAIIQGLLALLTPCVYPMIPITVSFFIKQGERQGRQPFLLAATYACAIIFTFTAVGLLLGLIIGPAGASRVGSHPLSNLFLALLFVAFALSLFGLFEFRVPSSWQNYFSGKGRSGGYVGAMFMGLAFTLASLTCTAPFIGALLGMAATGDWFWPLVGMLGFSFAFAVPFFFLALFPQYLARMPRSGGWMNAVKVVMGFLVLAASLKFLSNVDVVWQWGVFTRPVLLAAWSSIAVFSSLYLLGRFRLPHDAPVESIGVMRMLFSLTFLVFGLYLAGGLFGGRISGAINAFLPADAEATTGLIAGPGESRLRWETDYGAALARARTEQKPIFIDFTGKTCTNCKWMEANMFPRPQVQEAFREFVLVRLSTDSGPNWRENQKMQVERFGNAVLPLYVVLTATDREIARFEGMTRDVGRFVAFLKKGLAALEVGQVVNLSRKSLERRRPGGTFLPVVNPRYRRAAGEPPLAHFHGFLGGAKRHERLSR